MVIFSTPARATDRSLTRSWGSGAPLRYTCGNKFRNAHLKTTNAAILSKVLIIGRTLRVAFPNLLSAGKQRRRSGLLWSIAEGRFCRGLSMPALLPIAQETN